MPNLVEKESKKSTSRGGARPGAGRPKGAVAKTTTALKDAILLAAEKVGEDGKGTGGLVGYLKCVATTDVKAFSGLLGRVLPLQVTGEGGGPVVARIERVVVRPSGDAED